MHGLTVYVKEGLPFARGLSLKNFANSYLCFRLALLHSLPFSSIDHVLRLRACCLILFHLTQIRFSRSTHLLFLSLETFNVHHNLVNSVIIFLSQMTLLRWSTFLLGFQTAILIVLLLWISSDASICSTIAFRPLGNFLILSQFSLTFHQIDNGMPHFIAQLMTILVLIGMVFMSILEIFHGRTSLSLVFLLYVVNFVSGSRLEVMHVSLIENIRSNIIHLHGFQLLVLLPQLIKQSCLL